jgi:hypothetical protein
MKNTGEPRVWKLTSAVRGKAGGKGPSHWYLACCLSYYDSDEPLPDHSSLSRIRTRYGVELFRRFFEAIVDQCQQAGLVWGKELYVDATKINAHALTFLLRFCGSLNRVFGEDGAKMIDAGGTSMLCALSSTIEFFKRLDGLYEARE